MPIQSILTPSGTDETNSVKDLLQSEENSLKQNAPGYLKPVLQNMESPSKLFGEYQKTGEPMFKDAAVRARKNLLRAVRNPEEAVRHHHLNLLREHLEDKQNKEYEKKEKAN